MIVSHKHKFIFIKTVKTAGTSIEVFLSQFLNRNDISTPIFPNVKPHIARNHRGFFNPFPELFYNRGRGAHHLLKDQLRARKFYNHIPASVAKHRLPKDIWNNYYKFCVERSPWDKTLSHYNMICKRSEQEISLDEYFEDGKFCLNYKRYCDQINSPIVDRIIRYETMTDELGEVFEQLKIPFSGSLGVNAKSDYRKDRRKPNEIFTQFQNDEIARIFKVEIDLFGYTQKC